MNITHSSLLQITAIYPNYPSSDREFVVSHLSQATADFEIHVLTSWATGAAISLLGKCV